MKRTLIVLALMFALAFGWAEAATGAAAPDFKIARVLNAPVSKVNGLADLKGKVVFIEFWATWCAPCVASIPHMNRLLEAVKGEPVVFIAVTDESTATINTFLKTHEMKSWIGIDQKKSSLKAFKVVGRPDGYLIGKDGKLLARISPGYLEEKALRAAIAGSFIPEPIEWEDPEASETPVKMGKTFFEARITSAYGKAQMSTGAGLFSTQSTPFADNIARVWDVEVAQVMMDTQPVSAFNITLRTPPESLDQGRELLKTAIQAAFGVRVVPEQRETDVFVLTLSTAPGAPLPKPGVSGGKSGLMRYGGGHLLGTAEMPRIARALWMSLDRPVVDETGLKGVYEFDMQWTYGKQLELDSLLAAQGMSLVPARRNMEFLRVVPAKP
ncbi:MAG: hypothetical protein A2270_11695 [Elusimicrobia bacterium RIFOXYA12_FULL_51_18]|nr:MAG: hypothetical protein A2270_11695 [Elusimicrobia bacterium RIFOXYA12_FULL_51_18]OGS28828.1 MAG: hypothetical protein A2218_09155 [Elusimicrobia bacterium RIFOXYA2_FULL_53_38]